MKYYYELFSDLDIRPQVGDDSYGKIGLSENRPQLGDDFSDDAIFRIPWDHIKLIIDTEQFLDMLFYNIPLHCYVVIEVKVNAFDPRDMGQLSTYVAAVDGILRKDGDNQTIGLLICKNKDKVLAQYSVNSANTPIGISEYEISHALPNEIRNSMPTIEEIENELNIGK